MDDFEIRILNVLQEDDQYIQQIEFGLLRLIYIFISVKDALNCLGSKSFLQEALIFGVTPQERSPFTS